MTTPHKRLALARLTVPDPKAAATYYIHLFRMHDAIVQCSMDSPEMIEILRPDDDCILLALSPGEVPPVGPRQGPKMELRVEDVEDALTWSVEQGCTVLGQIYGEGLIIPIPLRPGEPVHAFIRDRYGYQWSYFSEPAYQAARRPRN